MESAKRFSSLKIPSGDGSEISGRIYRQNEKIIILSNMDTNEPDEWDPLVDTLLKAGYSILQYSYNRDKNDCLHDLFDVMDYVKRNISKRFILVGASRGGVISLKSAINPDYRNDISAVIALSAPQVYEGELFYSDEDLKLITSPVFLINSELDDAVSDTEKMYEMIEAKKEIMICSGNGHGTEMFRDNKDVLPASIEIFISNI